MAPSSHQRGGQAPQEGGQEDASLLARVRAHDAFFCQMVDLVPPELYLPKGDEEDGEPNAKYYKVRRVGQPRTHARMALLCLLRALTD